MTMGRGSPNPGTERMALILVAGISPEKLGTYMFKNQ
jgi:hypothetical protein